MNPIQALLLALLFAIATLFAGCEDNADTAQTTITDEDEDSSTPDPIEGDYVSYVLDSGDEKIVEDATADNFLGEDPFIGASLNTNSGYIEVIMIDGLVIETGGDGVAGGDLFINLYAANQTGVQTDEDDLLFRLTYAEQVLFETFDDAPVAYYNLRDGNSSIEFTTIGDVGDTVEGAFDGILVDGHTLSGTFRATRMADDYFGDDDTSVPQAIYDLTACSGGVQVQHEIFPDGSGGGGSVAVGECHVYYFTADVDADHAVDLSVTSGDSDLYGSSSAEFNPYAASETSGTVDEAVTLMLTAGDSALAVVAGVTASDYGIQVTTSP